MAGGWRLVAGWLVAGGGWVAGGWVAWGKDIGFDQVFLEGALGSNREVAPHGASDDYNLAVLGKIWSEGFWGRGALGSTREVDPHDASDDYSKAGVAKVVPRCQAAVCANMRASIKQQ